MRIKALLVLLQTEKAVSLPFHLLQLVKSLPFSDLKYMKVYLIRAEPSRIGHYKKG